MELCVCKKTQARLKINASQLISNMICRNYANNKKFGVLQIHSGYEQFYLNSPKGYSRKIINAQTGLLTLANCEGQLSQTMLNVKVVCKTCQIICQEIL